MRNRSSKAFAMLAMLLLPLSVSALSRKAEVMVVVADSRGLHGWRAWLSNLYNDSHLLFAVLTVASVPLLALLMGRITSWFMGRLGINLKTRQLAEH